MARRITNAVDRGHAITVLVNGKPVTAYSGETVATVLLVNGVSAFSRSAGGEPRGPFCNMGSCFECLVQIDAGAWVRACLAPVKEGMSIVTDVTFAERRLAGAGSGDGH